MWFIGVEVEQETSAPPPKKKSWIRSCNCGGNFFQMLVCGDVVYAQTWQVLTLKNCIEPPSYASTAYFVAWP